MALLTGTPLRPASGAIDTNAATYIAKFNNKRALVGVTCEIGGTRYYDLY